MPKQYKRYVATIEIRDGDYEYYSVSQHQIDQQEMDKSEDWEQFALNDILGADLYSSDYGNWYESDSDYRLYRLYSLEEIKTPEHVELLRSYGIH